MGEIVIWNCVIAAVRKVYAKLVSQYRVILKSIILGRWNIYTHVALAKGIIDNGMISATFRETDRTIRIIEKDITVNDIMWGWIRESEAVFRIIVNSVVAEGDIATTVALDTI